MYFQHGVALNGDTEITRQILYDLWALGTPVDIAEGDLAMDGTLFPVAVSTAPTASPYPGQVWYDSRESLWKVFTDVWESTGISLWLSIGPDRFDVPALARVPIPPYGLVYHGTDVRNGAVLGAQCRSDHIQFWGLSAKGTTAASGTWFPLCVEGITFGLVNAVSSDASFTNFVEADPVTESWNPLHCKESYLRNGGLVFQRFAARPGFAPNSVQWVGLSLFRGHTSLTWGSVGVVPILLYAGGRRASDSNSGLALPR